MPEDWQTGGFGLYIHWPFCQSKCPYCDFNSHVSATIDQKRWLKAYLSEIARVGQITGDRVLDTVFFGGGTPSLMDPEIVGKILDSVRKTWRTSNSFEVTLEANPTSVEAGRFQGFSDAGVNRISMGIQALNDPDLVSLGRLHTVAEGRQAFDIARRLFDRISFDLIYARQNQTLQNWQDELTEAIDLAADHLSLYQLTIEDGTAFGDRLAKGKLLGIPPDNDAADMYFATQDICEAAGLPGYEVSNHARPGSESRHNLIYWNYGDYAGIGPGAHGRLTIAGSRHATESYLQPEKWISSVEDHGSGQSVDDALSTEEQASEFLLMGMRLRQGIDLSRYERAFGKQINAKVISDLVEIEMIQVDGNKLRATDRGRPVLNSVIRELLP